MRAPMRSWAGRCGGRRYCYWLPRPARRAIARRRPKREDAVSLDANDPWARMTCGLSLSQAAQHERALAELRAALELNPSFALGHMVFGWALLPRRRFRRGRHRDRAGAAHEPARQLLRLLHLDPWAGAALRRGVSRKRCRICARRSRRSPNFPGHYNTLISCCGHLGLIEEAQGFIAIRDRMGPPLRLSVLGAAINDRFANKDVLLDGLRKAGVPD